MPVMAHMICQRSKAPGWSRASHVGQHVVVVFDDIRVLRRVDQRVVLIGAFLRSSRLPSQRRES
jgi:hypothetical protein